MENQKDQKPQEVTFEYKISQNYTVHAVTGVFGGINGQGQIIVNFFNDRHAIPKTQTYGILPDGALSPEPIAEEIKPNLMRDVMFSISINPQTARVFAAWLIEKADQFDRIIKEKGEMTDVEIIEGVH